MSATQRCRAYGHDRFRGVIATLRADTARYLHRSPEASSGGDDFKHRLSAFASQRLQRAGRCCRTGSPARTRPMSAASNTASR